MRIEIFAKTKTSINRISIGTRIVRLLLQFVFSKIPSEICQNEELSISNKVLKEETLRSVEAVACTTVP